MCPVACSRSSLSGGGGGGVGGDAASAASAAAAALAAMDGAAALSHALAGPDSVAEKERRLSEMIFQLQLARDQLLSSQEIGKILPPNEVHSDRSPSFCCSI
ncbi:hypothetical protein R5R35_004202 [Gryllus longicercus]|uniref:Uncharacterized protein n=1 Tax=Gryllus longicercus TaxID=2509291 RepID=A0AAN9V5N2_9ORTH